MDFVHNMIWFLMGVAAPLLAPIALLPVARVHGRYRGKIKTLLYRSVKEGQLLWTVIAMCTSAMYEAGAHLQKLLHENSADVSEITISLTAIGWHVLVMLVSSLAVLMGTLEAFDQEQAAQAQKAAQGTAELGSSGPPLVMYVSIVISIITAVTFTVTHIWAD